MRLRAAMVLGLLPLAGCAAIGPAVTTITSAGIAGSVGSATGSAVLGAIAGIGVSYGIDQGVKYAERRIHDNVQRAVATAAGTLSQGQAAGWQVPERLPLSGRSGKLEVARHFGLAIPCKDVIFTVDEDHDVYTTTICLNDQSVWVWAAAEPSIHRWGGLQ